MSKSTEELRERVVSSIRWHSSFVKDNAKNPPSMRNLTNKHILESEEMTLKEIMGYFDQELAKRVEEAFKHGQAVGQYQAADKMYGDVTQIYMFGGNESAAKAKSIAGWSANGLLKDCEDFMNRNRDYYERYLASLNNQTKKGDRE